MVSLHGLSPGFARLLACNFPFLENPSCLTSACSERYLDFLEVYSGKGNLSAAAQRVTCNTIRMAIFRFFLYLLVDMLQGCGFAVVSHSCAKTGLLVADFDIENHASEDVLTEHGKLACSFHHSKCCLYRIYDC